jgi:hypothetical protein
MAKNKSGKSGAKSLDELIEFFDSNDMSDLWDQMPAVEFGVDIKRRIHLVAIDEELADRLAAVAKSKRTSSEKLVNIWLREKLAKRENAR